MNTKSGLIYLLSNSDSVLHIAHHLLKSSLHLNIESSGSAGHLGAKLALHIQALQSLDHICCLLESGSEEEEIEEELFDDLKMLFSLTYLGFGKEFVCKILAIDDFLKPVITCLWYPAKLSDPDPVVEKTEEEKKPTDKSDEEGKCFAIILQLGCLCSCVLTARAQFPFHSNHFIITGIYRVAQK